MRYRSLLLTSSSLMTVAASLVTNSFSRWLMIILFMPGREGGGGTLTMRQLGGPTIWPIR